MQPSASKMHHLKQQHRFCDRKTSLHSTKWESLISSPKATAVASMARARLRAQSLKANGCTLAVTSKLAHAAGA